MFFSVGVLLVLAAAANARSLDGRIVNGEDVFIEDFPYQVSLLVYGMHYCGGSIIGPKHILTAAHCTDDTRLNELTVRVGSTFATNGGKIINVSAILQHAGYVKKTFENDISVLVLEEAIEFGEEAQAVAMTDSEMPEGANCDVTGWGYLEENGSPPKLLNHAVVPIISRATCREMYGQDRITDNMICAGYADGSKDACQGDSGGPLVHDGKQVGIVSWGTGCGRPNRPGIYSNVASLRAWVKEQSGI